MAVAFGLQIYLDFSGYTRIAIGSAKLCGIPLVDNFNYPSRPPLRSISGIAGTCRCRDGFAITCFFRSSEVA